MTINIQKKEVRKMLKKIYEELVLIRKELQTIRKKIGVQG